MSARRRRIGLVMLGVLALLLVGVAIGEASGWPFLRMPAQRLAERAAGVPVAVGEPFRLRLIVDPSVRAGTLRIGAGDGLALPHLLDGRDMHLAWRWGDLWRAWRGAPLRLDALEAGALDLRLVRDDQGRASWHLGARKAPRAQRDADDRLPRIGRFTLRGGRITIDDAPLDTKLQIAIEGGEQAAGGGYGVNLEGRWRSLPLALKGRTGEALPLLNDRPGDAQQPAIALKIEGTAGQMKVAFDGEAAALLEGRRLAGELDLRAPSLAALSELGGGAGPTLPQTPPLRLHTWLRHDGGVWQLDGARADIGRSRLAGDFRFDGNSTPRRLSGKLEGPRLLLSDLAPAVGAPPKKAAPATASDEPRRVLPQRRFDLPSLSAMDADVQVAIDELDFGSDAIASLQGLRTQLRLHGGVLELQQLQANTAAGRIEGSTRLDARDRNARWAARLRLSGIDAGRWLRIAQRYLDGTLAADLDLTGAGQSTAQILGSLDGRATVTLRDGAMSHLITEAIGLDVAQALGVAIRGDEKLPLRCARFELAAKDGVLSARRAVLDNRDSTLRIGGSVDLGQETLSLAMRSRPKDFSPLSLRSPVTLTGTFAAPQLGIDSRKLAGRVLGAVVLGAVVGPVAALLPLADTGDRDAGDPCAATPR